MKTKLDVGAVARGFRIHGELLRAEPYGSGHINDTYCAVFNQAGTQVRYIFQRINQAVFQNPVALMENVSRVTTHLGAKLAGQADRSRRALSLVAAHDEGPVYRDETGGYWRVYLFIEKARTYDVAQSPAQAFEAAKAFGLFQKQLADLPAPKLRDTIPGFHHTPKRFAALERAIELDTVNRAAVAKAEIEFALRHQAITDVLLDAQLPERVTHNDTKLNNVMLDDATGEGICVIDLDTVMPGLLLYDFGDLVRTTTSPAPEDERDLSRVRVRFPMFEALTRGYLASTGDFLTKAEKRHLAFSGKLITFEIGIRFLTDFLAGDIYFKVRRPDHNIDRCRTQFRLVESIEQQEEQMSRLVESIDMSEGSANKFVETR
jgi:aminoglycoside phosphotransferase (APT) family kinase protein